MQPDTEQLMKRLHASLCPDKLEIEIRDKFLVLEAEIERLKTLSVNNIMLAVVPGEDGGGQEIYAESADDVVSLLSDMGERLEDYVGELSTAHTHIDQYITALAACRDMFPAPKPFTALDSYYVGAMSDPLAVPEYIGMCISAGKKSC